MADDESRAARQKALAEKKRRLEEIKARRRGGSAAATADSALSTDANATPATANNNLDSYIDDLLKTSTPGLTLNAAAAPPTAISVAAGSGGDESKAEEKDVSLEEGKASTETSATAPSNTAASTPAPSEAKVETFEIAIQCEEDDFPPPSLIDEDEPLEEGSAASDDDDDKSHHDPILQTTNFENKRSISTSTEIQPSLTTEQKNKMLSSPPFTQFLSTASKRVERLLGASDETMYGILNGSGWGSAGASGSGGSAGATASAVDFSVDYANEEEDDYYDDDEEVTDGVSSTRRKKRRSKKTQEEAYQTGGYFTARATYEFPKFTRGRNVTDIEWCPSHKEWVLASYNAVSGSARGAAGGGGEVTESGIIANMGISNPTTRHLSPHDPSSSFLQTSPSAIPNEGIVAIYNLSMPSRPEHVFCAGCPILHSQFHPTEHPKLILGGGSSGQVLVWDARVGRYPVQRSSALGGGHDCELVGMKVLGDGNGATNSGAGGTGSITTSKLVTASSDGKINYWSVSNLREPVEHVNVNANLSSLEVLHGSNNEGVVCGDEKGGLHVVTSGTGRDGSSSNKRVVRRLHPGGVLGMDGANGGAVIEEEADAALMEELAEMGHYGMVTSVATRPTMPTINSPRSNKESTSSAMGGGMSKGFLRGAGGLMVTTGVDWSTKLWAPAYCDGPLMSFLSNSYDYMCDVQWSPVHPSVFATASSNGTLNIWNLASTLDQPVSGTEGIPIDHFSAGTNTTGGGAAAGNADSLNRLKWSADGRRMAVASGDKLHVLGVGEDVWKSKGDEEGRVMHNLVSRGLIQQE